MSVHGQLRDLVARHGERVLHQSDDLRGLLDDYFVEGDVSTGEINLLVDAVRLHAFDRLLALLDQGADPRTAVEAAGQGLAEERSGDPRTATWACATLGYAVGRVPDALVRAYGDRPTTTQPPHPAPPPRRPGPPAEPTRPVGQPAYGIPPPGGAVPPPGWQGPSPGSPSRRGLLVAAGTVATTLVVLAVLVLLLTRGDDDPVADRGATERSSGGTEISDGTTTEPTEPTEPTSEPTEPTSEPGTPVPVSELEASYAALGSTVGADADSCEVADPAPGTVERLRCDYQHLSVLYTTYADEQALETERQRRLDVLQPGPDNATESHVTDDGAYVLDQRDDRVSLYWDASDELTSGVVSARTERLWPNAARNWFDQRGEAAATRELPPAVAPFVSDALWVFARDYVGDQVRGGRVRGCEVNPNENAPFPQLERVECTDGDFTVIFVALDPEVLPQARDHFAQYADVDITWDWFGDAPLDYPVAGSYMETYNPAGSALVYWDDTGQAVYGAIEPPDGDHKRAEAYWTSGDAAAS